MGKNKKNLGCDKKCMSIMQQIPAKSTCIMAMKRTFQRVKKEKICQFMMT